MKLKNLCPIIVTEDPIGSRDFYIRHFGFSIVFEQDWYVHLVNQQTQLAFMVPNHPSQPPIFQAPWSGKGLILNFEVEDAEGALASFDTTGVEIALPLTQEDWGEIHFAVRDPNGIVINVTQMTDATDEYASSYVTEAV